jgi:hypothetical protein
MGSAPAGATVDLRRSIADAPPAWRLERLGEQARQVAHQVQLALARITRFAGVEVFAHPTSSFLCIDRLASKLDVLGRRVELLGDRIPSSPGSASMSLPVACVAARATQQRHGPTA